MKRKTYSLILLICLALITPSGAIAQYRQPVHKPVPEGAIAVEKAGTFDKPGATYMLKNNISSDRSAVFLGKDVTLDLNGYTITFSDGKYGHVKNYGFEEGLEGWDLSKAPGAKLENTEDVHSFIGKKLLSLKAGDVITSSYVYLPIAGRSYFAMCGLTGNYYEDMGGDLSRDMRISVFVEDGQGNEVLVKTTYGDTAKVSCPVLNRSTQLGGGFIFAHLNNLPAGNYRVRVRAETDCLVDEIDIRPAMDVGIGIVGKTHPMGHYDHLYNRNHAAFFDYTSDIKEGKPVEGIPVAEGTGTVTIKNGIIKNGAISILSWGIQSTAPDVRVILDNVKILNEGINATAADLLQATITYCTFDVRNPFIINRHGSEFYGVDIQGEQSSEVSFSAFYGGQGCLCFKGLNSTIHHNHFVNTQTVTNHYCVMAMGDGSKIFENLFEPETGSCLEIFRHKNIDIFNNEFHVKAELPSCEYHLHLSTNGVRIADYGAALGSPTGSYGNRVYNNTFYITGRKFRQYPGYIPMASAFFYSASAGDNFIFGNDIKINQEDPTTDAEAFAFYIGNARGGKIFNNHITSNVTPLWVGSTYGKDEDTELRGNIIVNSCDTCLNFFPVRMGSYEQPDFLASGVRFCSNELRNCTLKISRTDQHHSFTVSWTMTIILTDKSGGLAGNREVKILDRNKNEIVVGTTDKNGILTRELPEYTVDGDQVKASSPYTIIAGKKKEVVELNSNREIRIGLK